MAATLSPPTAWSVHLSKGAREDATQAVAGAAAELEQGRVSSPGQRFAFDSYGVVGLNDIEAFVDCLSGPAFERLNECRRVDVDDSGAIDLAELAELQRSSLGD